MTQRNNVLGKESGLAGGGDPPQDDGMEKRVAKLEALIPTLATRADLVEVRSDFQKGVNDLIKWIVGTALVGMAMFITIMTFVLNNAAPKAAPPAGQSPAPIVIQVPAAPPLPKTQP